MRVSSLACLLVLTACPEPHSDDTPSDTEPDTDEVTADCVPSEAAFVDNALPVIEASCSGCHGATPQFGAPYSLLDYDALVAGGEGERPVDKIVSQVSYKSMPPATAEPLQHAAWDTLIGWASCGEAHPEWSADLEADRDVHQAPEDPPADATPTDLLAPDVVVSPTTLDDYRNFVFRNVVESDVFIRRIEGVIDESRVVHHITLENSRGYLYAWAPGTGAIQFPDGGLRLRPSESLTVQLHYNNGAGIEGVRDSSGVRIWTSEPGGTEWGMLSPNVWAISVPPHGNASATQRCTATQDFDIFAAMPHMHEIGSAFEHVVKRGDGTEESLISLTGWSFEAQYFYDVPVSVAKGDQLTMTCTYSNPHDYRVNGGLGTSDEMCFDFMYVTPVTADCR